MITADDLGQDSTNRTNNQQAVGGQPSTSGPAYSGSTGASGGGNNPNKTLGSGYTNIQKIVQANQGNQLGQTVGQGIQQAGSGVQQQLGQAQNQFNQQTQQNQANTSQNQQLVGNVLNNAQQYTPGGQNASQGNQFSQLISGQYGGPQGLQGADTLQSRAQNVGQMGQALNTSAGRTGLLQQLVGNPQYTQGQQNLDSLLLGQSKDPSLNAARQQSRNLQGQVNTGISGAQAVGQQAANQARQFGQGIQQQLGSQLSKEEQGLSQSAADQQSKRNQALTALQGDLSKGQIGSDIAGQLGIQQGAQTFNVDPSKFLAGNPITATEQNVATPEQVAQIQALQRLAGSNAGQQASDVFGKFAGAQNQAGTFANSNPYTLNAPGYQQAYNAAQTQYHSQLDPVQQNYNNYVNSWNNAQRAGGLTWAMAQAALAGPMHQADQQLQATKASLNNQYGTNTFNVTPGTAYPNLPQGNS